MLTMRVAALESDQAYQEFRRQSMVILTGAELAYWNLYYAQIQLRFSLDSLQLGATLYQDSQARHEVGKATELEVLEANVAVTNREANVSVAEQALTEAANVSLSFIGSYDYQIRALTPPELDQPEMDLGHCVYQAQIFNPEYIVRERQIAIEGVRLKYALNQKRPSLNLRGSFGVTGLAESLSDSLSDVGNGSHPTWSLGLEFRLPLGGGKKAKSDHETAQMRERQAKLQFSQLQTQLRSAMQNALQKVISNRKNVESYRKAVNLNQVVLDTELERLKVGKVSNQVALEAEEKLSDARNLELNNVILHQRAILELHVLMGVVLENRGIDLSREELARRTSDIFDKFEMTDAEIEHFNRVTEDYNKAIPITQ
jgi:outer membrane protein TolC